MYHDDLPKPSPEAVEYFRTANAQAKARAVATGRYVTVRYGEDAPNSRGQIGLTYSPTGEDVISGSALPARATEILQLVALANAALDAGLTTEKGGE